MTISMFLSIEVFLYIFLGISICFLVYALIKRFGSKPALTGFICKIKKSSKAYQKGITLNNNQKVLVFKQSKFVKTVEDKHVSLKKICVEEENQRVNPNRLDFYLFTSMSDIELPLDIGISRSVFDAEYQVPIRIYPKGNLKVNIINYDDFFYYVVKFVERYEYKDFTKGILNEINIYLFNLLAEYLSNVDYTVLVSNYYLEDIEKEVSKQLNEYFYKYGVEIKDLYLYEIEIEEDDNSKSINKILLNYQKFILPGYTYQLEKQVEYLKNEHENHIDKISGNSDV